MSHIPGGDNTDQIRNDSKTIPQSGFLDPQTARNDISASRVVVLPAPFERTTSYIKGTAKAPEAIINASHQVEYYDPVRDLDNIARFIHTTVPLKAPPDLSSDGYLSSLKKKVSRYLEMDKLVVVLGGEHTISLLLAITRQLPFANATTHAGEWARKRIKPIDLRGKTVGIVGLGRVGSIVATRAESGTITSRATHHRITSSGCRWKCADERPPSDQSRSTIRSFCRCPQIHHAIRSAWNLLTLPRRAL